MITKLLKSLAKYYKEENDLSNVVCILCNIDTEFKETFIHYFFEDIDINTIGEIKREVYAPNRNDSRVDLYFESNGLIYIIEVKIGDKNHHFSQYNEAFNVPMERFGYITNYYCPEGSNVKEWEDLYWKFVKANKTKQSKVIEGFLAYLKDVCGIITEPIYGHRDENFIRTVRNGIINHPNLLTATGSPYKVKIKTIQETGFYAQYPPYDSDKNTISCTAKYKYVESVNRIVLSVELKGERKQNQEKLMKVISTQCDTPIKEGDNVIFIMKQSIQEEFESSDYLRQRQILRRFIDSTLQSFKDVLSGTE